MKLDMHFHSTASDGLYNFGQIIAQAKAKEIDFLALTDHDIVSDEFSVLARENGISSCHAVEISAYNRFHGKSLHLTLYAQSISQQIQNILSEVIVQKNSLMVRQVQRFIDGGFQLSLASLKEFYQSYHRHFTSLNKFDIVYFMYRNPYNRNLVEKLTGGELLSEEEFYVRFLKRGGDRYDEFAVQVENYEVPLEVCSMFVQKTQGILSLAHPNVTFKKSGIATFQEALPHYMQCAGLNAIEINTCATKEWVDAILEAKNKYGLYLTFGSDFHKENHVDGKHGELGMLNPHISSEFARECFDEYKQKIVPNSCI